MKRIAPYCLISCLLVVSCAPNRTSTANLARENEQRLASLEDSVNALNSQIAQLNNRVYEVRTKSGQKTSMTVVPITASSLVSDTQAVKTAPVPAQPAGRVVQPRKEPPKPRPPVTKTEPVAPAAVAPAPHPAAAAEPALPAEAQVAPQAGPAGSIGAQEQTIPQMPAEETPVNQIVAPASNVTLTPAPPAQTSPPANIPVPRGNVPELPAETANPLVPVPLLPSSELIPAEPAPQQQPAPAAAPRTSQAKPAQGEQAAYNAALNAARSGRTAEGIRLFREFLQKYPKGRYAANADYWIGECLFAQGKYQEALSEFNQVNDAYPSHHKNADALLKAGITMSKMGDKEGAAAKFRTVIANFPNSEAARRARAMGVN